VLGNYKSFQFGEPVNVASGQQQYALYTCRSQSFQMLFIVL
jgi:hypothetical protein